MDWRKVLGIVSIMLMGSLVGSAGAAAARKSANTARDASSAHVRVAKKAQSGAHFGVVRFATSCSPDVQLEFDTGVAQLHSFQYQQAGQTFHDILKQDPTCVVAHWGAAMSLYHQLWDWPSDATMAEGRAEIQQAFRPAAKTERERDYVRAAAVFFQDNPKLTREQRVHAYSEVMGKLFKQFSDDVDAGAFYALSLIAIPTNSKAGEMANREAAIDILNKLSAVAPRHPGVAHYMIHACDTPELAPQGLAAAKRYASIAPDSSHALHMPSHIFVRLGMWQETIASNLASEAAAAEATKNNLGDSDYQFHAMDFLDYAYLQSGQAGKAHEVYAEIKDVPGASAEDIAENQAIHAARDALELHDWKTAAALPVEGMPASVLSMIYRVRAIGSARSGDVSGAEADLAQLRQGASSVGETSNMSLGSDAGQSIRLEEASAWVAFAEGKAAEAIKQMRDAADREDAAGVDTLLMPAREMLGDLLLELHRPAEALEAYRTTLKEAPNRFDSVYGAAQAAQAAGKAEDAHRYLRQLVAICGPGADRPELQEAKTILAKN